VHLVIQSKYFIWQISYPPTHAAEWRLEVTEDSCAIK
jgi:hypothetical protein